MRFGRRLRRKQQRAEGVRGLLPQLVGKSGLPFNHAGTVKTLFEKFCELGAAAPDVEQQAVLLAVVLLADDKGKTTASDEVITIITNALLKRRETSARVDQGMYDAALEALTLVEDGFVPVPMVLHCPECGKQHLDINDGEVDWSKRRHRTHKCVNTPEGANTGCGHEWRPHWIYTVGVLRTPESEPS